MHVVDYIKKNPWLLLVILPAFFLYMFIIFPSGSFYCFINACGINFWGVHGHDGIWHLAIANVSFQKFPFIAPTFSGENLYGYNYLFDFFIFLLSKIGIPSLISYFKVLPVIWFILFSYLLIKFARALKDNSLFVLVFLFTAYFVGSFSYILTLINYATLQGSSGLLTLLPMHTMSNPPFAFSLIFFILLLLNIKGRKITLRTVLLANLYIFISLGLKFYGGVISGFIFVIFLIVELWGKNLYKLFQYLFITLFFGFLAIFLFYNPFQSVKSGSIFGIAIFALVHPITEESNQFYLRSLTDARYYLLAQHKFSPRLIAIESFNLLLFLFFYLGTRFFGFFFLIWSFMKNKLSKFDFVILSTISFSLILTLTLVQKAEWWNTIQFFYYLIFLMTIYLAYLIYALVRSKNIIFIIIGITIMLTSLPSTLDLISIFTSQPGTAYISKTELQALEYLKIQPYGVVYAPLYKENWKVVDKPNQLYRYADTAYVAAFSDKPVYFANILQLRLTGIEYEQRLKKIKDHNCSILNEVDYIYEIRHLEDEGWLVRCNPAKVKKIYNSDFAFIYTVIKQ